MLDILEIIFYFNFNVMYLGENNGNISETTFLKMRKFFLDMRKDFLIMSNFYLAEILSEPKSQRVLL